MNDVKAWNRVADLGSSLRSGEGGLRDAPVLLSLVLREGAWKRFVTPRHEVVEHGSFAEFVTTPPTHGLGVSVDLVRRLVADDISVAARLEEALEGKQGRRTDLLSNVQEVKAPTGNTQDAALRRLRKNRPDLHAKVLAEELTPHRAMVTAGYRPATATVRLDDPERAARTLKAKTTPQFRAQLAVLLADGGG